MSANRYSTHRRIPASAWLGHDMPGTSENVVLLPRLPFAALSRLMIGLLVGAAIMIALTNPSGAQTPGSSPDTAQHNRNLFAQCMLDWDRATHMTKAEWARACERVLHERGDYTHASQQSRADDQRRVRYQ